MKNTHTATLYCELHSQWVLPGRSQLKALCLCIIWILQSWAEQTSLSKEISLCGDNKHKSKKKTSHSFMVAPTMWVKKFAILVRHLDDHHFGSITKILSKNTVFILHGALVVKLISAKNRIESKWTIVPSINGGQILSSKLT